MVGALGFPSVHRNSWKGYNVKFSKWIVLAMAAILAFALIGCGAQDAADEPSTGSEGETLSGSLTIEGSDTIVNLSQALAEDYMAANPEVMITVKGGGSGAGIAALLNGTVDFANASRNVKDEEKEEATKLGVSPVENTIALDGIAVIVNLDNPVKALTTEQIGQIYRGEITNWSEVGGSNTPIVLLGRDTSSGTYEYFFEAVVGEDNQYSKEMRNLQSSQAIVDEVANTAGAIGYVGMGYLDAKIHSLTVDGVEGSVENVKAGTYPLSRGLYMVSNGAPEGLGAAFLEWTMGAEGQAIVADEGFVAL